MRESLDEVTQDNELGTVLPGIKNINTVDSIVLVGDAAQLGPTVFSRFQVDPVTLKRVNVFDEPMAEALVERMHECDYPTYFLNLQYRTVAGVNDFPNKRYYNNKLLGAPTTALNRHPLAREANRYLQSIFGGFRTFEVTNMLLNVTDGVTLSGKSKSRSNPHNVAQTMSLIERLVSTTSFETKDISIATPYSPRDATNSMT